MKTTNTYAAAIGILMIAIAAVIMVGKYRGQQSMPPSINVQNQQENQASSAASDLNSPSTKQDQSGEGVDLGPSLQPQSPASEPRDFVSPLGRSGERVTKKPFGIFITPANSSVQPERFSGFHTGVDFESFADEADKDVSVHAVCDGAVLQKRTAGGYGGLLVQSCVADGQPITVVYGHLRLASISQAVGAPLRAGDVIGVLGKGFSSETDGERNHLHLGFHKGDSVNIKGYVSNRSELSGWLDPCDFWVCQNQ